MKIGQNKGEDGTIVLTAKNKSQNEICQGQKGEGSIALVPQW